MQTAFDKKTGGHEVRTNEWLTPREIIASLGEFDTDPCSPIKRPWPTARKHYTIEDDGLVQPWDGRVWMNPPYDREMIGKWMDKMAKHYNGIALTFARTDTDWFQRFVFPFADSWFLFDGRLNFYTVAGTRAKGNGGAPSCLISYGEQNAQAIADAGLKGRHLPINSIPMIVVGISPTWECVVNIALGRLGGEAPLKRVYEMVEQIAPDKVRNNRHFEAKVRQQLQQSFIKIQRGYYKRK